MVIYTNGSLRLNRDGVRHDPRRKKRRSSKAMSIVTSSSFPKSLDESFFPRGLHRSFRSSKSSSKKKGKVRRPSKTRVNWSALREEDPSSCLAVGQGLQQVRQFDAFVDVPSPFAKQKAARITKEHEDPTSHRRDTDHVLTDHFNSIPQPRDAPSSQPFPLPPDLTYPSEVPLSSVEGMSANQSAPDSVGCLDARTRATNLQHTRPEWTTWDFVDLYITGLPPNIRTIDIWNNFKKEGEVDLIDIFVNRSGQKDSQAKLRFRPPPCQDFFSSRRYVLELRDGPAWPISIALDRRQRRAFTRPSPVNEHVTYPETTELDAETIDFGVLVAPETMLLKTTKRSDRAGKVRMILDLGRRAIDIRFPSVYSGKTRQYKFLIPLDEAFKIFQCQGQTASETSFIMTLRKPPHVYKKLSDSIKSTHEDAAFTWREQEAWLRQTNVLSNDYEVDQLRHRPLSLKNHPEGVVNIGRWTTYRITFRADSINQDNYRVFRAALSDYNVRITKPETFNVVREGACGWNLLKASLAEFNSTAQASPPQSALQNSLADLFDVEKNDIFLPFPVRYQLEVCISNGWINEHNISEGFLRSLAEQDFNRAKQILETVALQKLRLFDPMDVFKLRTRWLPSMNSRVPDNCVLIHSAIVTPSALILNTPYLEMTNRVIRRYQDHADRFLRVRFEDDELHGFARIHATSQKTMDAVLNKVFRTLSRGIEIGDRKYEFLAAGNSQLREHGAYFFAASPSGPTANQMRAWMGQFEHERVVAKHAARIGQCFSTTRAIKNAGFPPVRKTDLIDDVEKEKYPSTDGVEKKKYIFTDGVGMISRFYAATISSELGIPGEPPSVFQFRMAGCKGVLALAPELGATNMKLRNSQYKFATTYSGMEIIRWSEYWVATLNRQLVIVLSALGVPDDVFLVMQEKELELMERALIEDSAALQALTRHVDPNRMTLTIANFVRAGFRQCNEPFVMSLLRLWRAWSIKYLKEKARLTVQDGAFLLGCTDETGTLKGHFDVNKIHDGEDVESKMAKLPEIFVQITCPQSERRKVITGLCVIARNPSLHPGDMRVVKAVNVPALHHLVDVLVLPQTGDRDLCSMCSGGDLDGDDYVVIWDERLLPRIWNAEPMDYTSPKPVKLDRDVTLNDIKRFFVKYMKNDFLPTIALAHLAWADYLDEGIRHGTCLELAQLHSKAVDYPKTGQAAQMPKALNAKRWPHFMEKKRRETYISRRILGQLYDAVERVAFTPDYDAPFDERILNACEPDEAVMRSALELKREYDTSLQRIMAQHDIKTEFEVWSTFVLDHSKASKDYKFHEEIGQLSGSVKKQYYNAVVEKAGGRNWAHLVPWAVAMYTVTRDELDEAKAQGKGAKMPFVTFPWLLSSTLIQIVKSVGKAPPSSEDVEGVIPTGHPAFNAETQTYDDPYQPSQTSEAAQGVPSGADDHGDSRPFKEEGLEADLHPSDREIQGSRRSKMSSKGGSDVDPSSAEGLRNPSLGGQLSSGSMKDLLPGDSIPMTDYSPDLLQDTPDTSQQMRTVSGQANRIVTAAKHHKPSAEMKLIDTPVASSSSTGSGPLIDVDGQSSGEKGSSRSTSGRPSPSEELIGLDGFDNAAAGSLHRDLLGGASEGHKSQPPPPPPPPHRSISGRASESTVETEQAPSTELQAGLGHAGWFTSQPQADRAPNIATERPGQAHPLLIADPFDMTIGSNIGEGQGQAHGGDEHTEQDKDDKEDEVEDEDEDQEVLMDPLVAVGESDVDRIIKLSGGLL